MLRIRVPQLGSGALPPRTADSSVTFSNLTSAATLAATEALASSKTWDNLGSAATLTAAEALTSAAAFGNVSASATLTGALGLSAAQTFSPQASAGTLIASLGFASSVTLSDFGSSAALANGVVLSSAVAFSPLTGVFRMVGPAPELFRTRMTGVAAFTFAVSASVEFTVDMTAIADFSESLPDG